jgi:hypothetical protein
MGGRKQKFKEPLSGIYILGEGITERYYFTHLKHLYGFNCTVGPRFFDNTSILEFERRIIELLKGDVTVICVFDADVSEWNLVEKERLGRLKNKYIKNRNVIFCDSFPSIEYWFLLHYISKCPHYNSSKTVEVKLRKYISDYAKTTSFLEKEKWVKDMSSEIGSLLNACILAKKNNSNEKSYTNVYKVIEKLKENG